jgi:hypothetical protein
MADDREKMIDDTFKWLTTEHGPTVEAFGRVPDESLKEKMIGDVRARIGKWYDEHSQAEWIKDEFTRENKTVLAGARVETDVQGIMWKAVKANERLDGKPERGSLSPEVYAKKLRDDLNAKTPQGHQQDHDRER